MARPRCRLFLRPRTPRPPSPSDRAAVREEFSDIKSWHRVTNKEPYGHRSAFKATEPPLFRGFDGPRRQCRLIVSPTLRQTWPRELPEAAMCVQDVDVQCVLQFTLIHAAGCALHRPPSRVIHHLELSKSKMPIRSVAARNEVRRPTPEKKQRGRTCLPPDSAPGFV